MKYGLIGEKLGHSYSREIHEAIADYKYELREIPPEDLDGFMRSRDFLGINVTIPYKQAVIPYLDYISDSAEKIGAVNTVVNRGGRLYGYNTDFAGLIALIERENIDVRGKNVIILGSGGTSKTAAAAAESLGAGSVSRVSRSGKDGCITYDAAYGMTDAEIIINTTPAGMYPNTDGSAADISKFPKLEAVIDAVYNPLSTDLVLAAKERGVKAVGGLYMLCAQAVCASAYFLDKDVDTHLTETVYRKLLNDKRSIALIGMPTSGKTTVGRVLAELSGKTLFDTDDVVTEKIGMPIAEYFAKYGEGAFRDIERRTVLEAAEAGGRVIATGGGTVLDARNIHALRRSSVIVFLDRSLNNLIPSEDRPLSSDREHLERLYRERYELYKSSADLHADGNLDAERVAQNIWRELCK